MAPTKLEDSAHGGDAATAMIKSDMNGAGNVKSFTVKGEVQPEDKGTKDDWVPRHPSLIRLTGRHPFNCEPPPTALLDNYVTDASLHYVRNHGAVPNISWESHRLTITGLVSGPKTFTMDELAAFPTHDVVCTLTCAGNRRKEQNMVKKTIGFNWGPAGTACSVWTGPRLSDILTACGVDLSGKAQHVCMRGPLGELPRGDDGSYGTSITLHRAMSSEYEVILAYKQNGELLTPDHGFPLRIVIPGFIGGRMIKWMEEICVTAEPSQSYYHFHDNRILPSHVDEESAIAEGWWFKPDYIFNELNINSAIIYPAHDSAVVFDQGSVKFKGYAYGNGTRITRCELSLDDGASWKLAEITQRPAANAAGREWAWVWWELDVPMTDMLGCKEVMCRAWDAANNSQPNTFTWNLMGMGNNCVFRVKVHPTPTSDGRFALSFEHPTIAAGTPGGWMNRVDGAAVAAKVIQGPSTPPSADTKIISMDEVEKHDTMDSAWFVFEGKVYDATPFLKEHPGGADSILLVAGTDATDEFKAIHSTKAKDMLTQYYIGDLEGKQTETLPPVPTPAPANGVMADLVALNPKKRIPFTLVQKDELSTNVRRFRFALQSPQHRFGLPVGKHVFLYAKIDGELVMRAYSPASSDDDLGYFDLVIRVYRADEHPRFPAGGKMSQHLDSLKIGDTMEVKGPVGHYHYLGSGNYTLDKEPHAATHINMIAGGTGLTPIYQVIKEVLKNPEDTTSLALLYANQAPEEILLREELDAMAAEHPTRFKVWYTVDRAPEDWEFSIGFINQDMVKERLHPATPTTITCLCGPPPMIKFACLPNLEAVGFSKEQCIEF